MRSIEKFFDLSLSYVFEPGLNWVIDHPAIAVVAIVGLVYWSVRGYRMI